MYMKTDRLYYLTLTKFGKVKTFFASFFHIRQFYDKIKKKTKKQVLI